MCRVRMGPIGPMGPMGPIGPILPNKNPRKSSFGNGITFAKPASGISRHIHSPAPAGQFMHDPDHQIIRRILDGDARAYRMLVDRHKGHGMTVAMRMLKNREDAEEALQDAFVKAYRALERFEFKARFSTWLYRILYNVCSDMLEKRRSHAVETSFDGDPADDDDPLAPAMTVASPDAPPDVRLAAGEMEKIVAEEIDKLPRQYAAMLTMFLLEEQSYNEIVEITGLPLGTVKTQLFRARAMLRAAVMNRVGKDAVQ